MRERKRVALHANEKFFVVGCARALRIETGCFWAKISNIYPKPKSIRARLYKHTRDAAAPSAFPFAWGARAISTPHFYSFTFARINYQSWANSIQYLAFSTRQCKALSSGYWARARLHKKFSKYVIPCSGIAQSHLYAPLPIQRRRHHHHTYTHSLRPYVHSTQGNLATPNYLNNFVLHWSGLHLCCTYATLSQTNSWILHIYK